MKRRRISKSRSKSRSKYFRKSGSRGYRGFGRCIGSMVGGFTPLGARAGGNIGDLAESGIRRIFGNGNYYMQNSGLRYHKLKSGTTPP